MPRISGVFQAILNKKYYQSPTFFYVETLVETFYLEVSQQNKTKIILLKHSCLFGKPSEALIPQILGPRIQRGYRIS